MFGDYDRILDRVVECCDLARTRCSTVLDIGVGTGNLAARFLEKGLHVIGIDPSEEMRGICRQKHPEITVLAGSFLEIPIGDESVDVVASTYAFHHLTLAEKGIATPTMKRVLKPGGRVIIADLMFRDASEKERIIEGLHQVGCHDTADEIDDEYPALVDGLGNQFRHAGFDFLAEQLTPSVWVCSASLTAR